MLFKKETYICFDFVISEAAISVNKVCFYPEVYSMVANLHSDVENFLFLGW